MYPDFAYERPGQKFWLTDDRTVSPTGQPVLIAVLPFMTQRDELGISLSGSSKRRNRQCQHGPDAFPFTGRKDSAEGTLSVSDALRVFSIRTLVAAKGNDLNKALLTQIVKERRSHFLSTDFLL